MAELGPLPIAALRLPGDIVDGLRVLGVNVSWHEATALILAIVVVVLAARGLLYRGPAGGGKG